MGKFEACIACDALAENFQNLSLEYSMMLLVQSLTRFLHLWDEGQLTALSDTLIRDRVPIVLLQALVRTLQRQNANGSWGSNQSSEETAYAVLFLVSIFGIPWVRFLEPQITSAIEAGRLYLNQYCEGWTKPAPLWIEKVSYGSGVLSQAYCISAINAPIPTCQGWGEAAKNLIDVKMEAVTKFSQFFSHLPLFCQEPSWKLHAAVVEGYLFLPHLKRVRLNIFPRKEMAEDKYLEYIPFTWIASNYRGGGYLSTKLIWDMMIISMLNYQADEYMEAVVGTQLKDNLEIAKRTVEKLIRETNGLSYGVKESPVDTSAVSTNDLASIAETDGVINISQIEKTLTRFITYVLDHPQVQSSSALDQQILRRELQNFLLAHITHIEDNLRFSDQEFSYTITTPFVAPNGTYHKWVHTTSADDTSCPYSFAFMSCLTANPGEDRFPSVQSKYISQDLCRHLATMCRQYNDYGSIARDRAEKNLNSVNFPEFHHNNVVKQEGSVENQNDVREEAFKAALFEIADYERDCLLFAMQKLGEAVPKQMGIWKTFVNVTDLYGQIYVARDIASRMR